MKFAAALMTLGCSVAWLFIGNAAAADAPDDPPSTPRQQAVVDRIEQFTADGARSSDLRLRIIFSLDRFEQTAGGAFYPHFVTPVATLIDQARGSTDPMTLDLLLWRCGMDQRAAPACDRLDLARRWVAADTQNQVAWIALATVQRAAGDVEAARSTFQRAAQASMWHEHYKDVAGLIAANLPKDLLPPERATGLVTALSKAAMTLSSAQPTSSYCKESKESDAMREACARVVATMFRDADTMLAISMSVPFAARAHVDRLTLVSYQQAGDAMRWAAQYMGSDYLETEDIRGLEQSIARLQSMIELGERGSLNKILLDHHVSEAEAAKRYVATLGEAQLKQRADRLNGL